VKTPRLIFRPTTTGWTTTDKAGTRRGISHASPIGGFQNPVSRKFERTRHEKRSPITLHNLAFTFGKLRASRVRARSLGVWKTCLSYFPETGFGNRHIGDAWEMAVHPWDVDWQPGTPVGFGHDVKDQPLERPARVGCGAARNAPDAGQQG
jgi:hypothetical protein